VCRDSNVNEEKAVFQHEIRMKAVILAGGYGTRLSEETHLKPKPMVEIGGKPILWHIMKFYSHFGIHEFIICLGYKGYLIKEYFANYFLHMSDVTFDMRSNQMTVHQKYVEPWTVTLIDTGINTMTGGRLQRVAAYLDSEDFCFTYGDGLADVNLTELVSFHKQSGRQATLVAVRPPGRFGSVSLSADSRVTSFIEKPLGDGGWINGGFFVLSPAVLDYLDGDQCSWEARPLEQLASAHELNAFQHQGFWKPMDTLRDRDQLEHLWASGKAPWKLWD